MGTQPSGRKDIGPAEGHVSGITVETQSQKGKWSSISGPSFRSGPRRVPKVSWSALIERHPAARLVAGVLPEGEAATGNLRKHLNLMAKLSACLAPKGSMP